MPTADTGAGNKALATKPNTAATTKLIHQGERSNRAKSDLSDILNFMLLPFYA